jgi:hypothetical protein
VGAKRKLKLKVISIFILTVVISITFYFSLDNKALSYSFGEQQPAFDNKYQKLSGQKILLKVQKSQLNGIWGSLELEPFIIQPTLNFIIGQTNYEEFNEMFKSSREWIFDAASINDIELLFIKSGLSKTIRDELLSCTKAIDRGSGFVTTPTDKLLWSLSPEIRAKLYPLIGKYDGNYMYNQPVCFNSENPKEWFYKSSLNSKIIKKLISLVYIKNGICYISDLHLILPLLKTDGSWNSFLQTIYRTKSMEAYLDIKEGQDIDEIVNYWGNLGRTEEVKPILESISRKIGGGKINIEELLPSIPQGRLNTYSSINEYETDFKDCHWTTINFFNRDIEERYYDLPDLSTFINKISKPQEYSQLKFGDIISIFNENDELVHSCTYIADNLVITKNGMGNLKPFVLSYMNKTVSLYGERVTFSSRTISNTHTIAVND